MNLSINVSNIDETWDTLHHDIIELGATVMIVLHPYCLSSLSIDLRLNNFTNTS